MGNFSHLHVHTEYSFLDGMAKIPELIEKAYQDGMRAMAITDHGNMYGVLDFVGQVEKFNKKIDDVADKFKSIIGCEVYVAAKSRHDKSGKEDRSGHHLILLAKNKTGYHNLCALVTKAYSEGMYYTPRVDKELLRLHAEGVIACSACLGGELPQAIIRDNQFKGLNTAMEELELGNARKVIEEFQSIYGEDYYLELQRNGHKEQTQVNAALLHLGQECGVKCIATNDSHFVDKEDADAHKMLICINTRKDYNPQESISQDEDTDKGMIYSGEEYFKTTSEMEELFSDIPFVITNTQEIVDKIDMISLNAPATLPKFDIPEGFAGEAEYLEHLVWEKAKARYPEMNEETRERIAFELGVVNGMGYPGYFLIVWDFMKEGREMGIRFGPGRGSAAGSALAYCLEITNIDPIKYDLLFERFLNPDRISLPDIDIDIDDAGREKVIQYVIEKYGVERVAQIVTFNTMAAKSAIRDCARVLKLPLSESDHLAKLVPEGPGVTLKKAFDEVKELKDAYTNGSSLVKDTLRFAVKLEGTIRNSGVHACGVIIGKDDLKNSAPLCTAKNSDTMVTQYEGKLVEDAGFLKMDFLGLKTLNIISSALYNIKFRFGEDLDIDHIPLDDPETYELLSRGDTTAIFQLESPGMRKHLQELKPERFEDIISMVSLYRPGPMDNIPSFINRKNGKEKIEYPIPVMEKYLSETYGITVYQEQVMLLSRLLADFTRGESDVLRKAMGKKLDKVMNEMEGKFYEGAMKKGYEKKTLEFIWSEWQKFASYAFNKSHATCYAYVAYQTAYLKAHYRAEFMAANLTNNLDNLDKITQLIEDTTKMGIKILSPDINESDLSFTVNKAGDIRFGLAALKGIGSTAVESIIEERSQNGTFLNIFDFAKRINLRKCNKRAIEALAFSGAFDNFDNIHRAQFFHLDGSGHSFIEKLINYGTKAQSNAGQNQFSIFDEQPDMEEHTFPEIPPCDPWHSIEQLRYEKDVAGFYVSGHPLDMFKLVIDHFVNTSLTDLNDSEYKKKMLNYPVNFVGIVTESQRMLTKTNKDYGKVKLEDYSGEYEWMIFGEDYTKYRHLFEVGKQLFIKGTFKEQFRGKDYIGEPRYNLNPLQIYYLQDACGQLCKEATLILSIRDITKPLAFQLNECAQKHPGKINLTVKIISSDEEFNSEFRNFNLKINPEEFYANLNLRVPYKFVLK
ncbi:MAG: DNA polymerase III subunit alpha [Bacteroidales bacterium]|jgi:DNA polymerase-3 subunit alpha|nr:DNA polymerase III subunit alpha [Bacteroidales bacterium]